MVPATKSWATNKVLFGVGKGSVAGQSTVAQSVASGATGQIPIHRGLGTLDRERARRLRVCASYRPVIVERVLAGGIGALLFLW